MHSRKKIRVLIVDDSIMFLKLIKKSIAADPDIEVIATAADPFEARDKIVQYHPNVMVCDVHMPKMNGIEFLRRLLPQYPLPVIVVSAVSSAVFDALQAGALEFIAKPVAPSSDLAQFAHELKEKIKVASKAKIARPAGTMPAAAAGRFAFASPGAKPEPDQQDTPPRLIAIGASTGGIEAIHTLLKSLPADVPGIVIVQHIPPNFSKMFAERLNAEVPFWVKEAQTGDVIERGMVLIAPGDKHMRVKRSGNIFKVECFAGEKVNRHCPSIDVLFESVANVAGSQAIGVLLTGMGYDGARGLLSMRRKGARTIGQDEASSVVYGMPRVAYELGAVEQQCSLQAMPQVICRMLK